jgi:hypothetical protein
VLAPPARAQCWPLTWPALPLLSQASGAKKPAAAKKKAPAKKKPAAKKPAAKKATKPKKTIKKAAKKSPKKAAQLVENAVCPV